MTPMQVKMPEKLSAKDIESLTYVFYKMSLQSKQSFIASLIVQYPHHYMSVRDALGNDCDLFMAQA